MSKKRKRDPGDVDVELVQVYEQLAHDDESERLQAAHKLVSKIFRPESTSNQQTKVILTRLFRGLCSSRKAARHGFAIALTELLSQVHVTQSVSSEDTLSSSNILDILEKQTTAEGGTSGQDERDHYFGRLFGADAIIKSGILFRGQDFDQWRRLLDMICEISMKKPWLRQECGWVLFSCISSITDSSLDGFVSEVVERLTAHKLIRTPEGVAIWIATVSDFPHAKLPKHVWKHADPLAAKEVKALVDILKDARPKSGSADTEFEAQGAATWSANLHFVWDCVLSQLFKTADQERKMKTNGAHDKSLKEQVSFEEFWKTVVDEGLFNPSSSAERKHWGLLVWARVLDNAPQRLVRNVFTKNAMHYLITSLRGENSYLKKHARRVIQLLPARAELSDEASGDGHFASDCVTALIGAVDFADFDQLTKSKTVNTIIEKANAPSRTLLLDALVKLFASCQCSDRKQNLQRCRYVLGLQSKLFAISLRQAAAVSEGQSQSSDSDMDVLLAVVKYWLGEAYFSKNLSGDIQAIFKERIATSFEQSLRTGIIGRWVLRQAVEYLRKLYAQGTPTSTEFDTKVAKHVERAFQRLGEISQDSETPYTGLKISTGAVATKKASPTLSEGMVLLYCVVLLEIYNGEAEAVEILEDLLAHEEHLRHRKPAAEFNEEGGPVDALVETLLSFAARPSKFMRRVSLQIFESLAPEITFTGLKSLTRVLATKENSQGQQEMFETGDIEDIGTYEEDEDDSARDSDVDMVDSDVEVVSAGESSSDESEDTLSDSGDDADGDEELAAFDAALASALGTRVGQNDLQPDDTSSSSDEDMNDDEMMALDQKLTEVFKARKEATSKKKEQKDAKGTIVNFKNRVLDLLEAYLKREYLNALSLGLVLPLLETIRTTQTKQIAERACGVLRDYIGRCKGQNVPAIGSESDERLEKILGVLRAVHGEACRESSNAHSAVASHASILLVKTLLNAGVDIRVLVEIYGDTRVRQLTDRKCHVQPAFFTDWNNWCAQTKTQLAKHK